MNRQNEPIILHADANSEKLFQLFLDWSVFKDRRDYLVHDILKSAVS